MPDFGSDFRNAGTTRDTVNTQFSNVQTYAESVGADLDIHLANLEALTYSEDGERFNLDAYNVGTPEDAPDLDRGGWGPEANDLVLNENIPEITEVQNLLKGFDEIKDISLQDYESAPEFDAVLPLTDIDLHDPVEVPITDPLQDIGGPNFIDDIPEPPDSECDKYSIPDKPEVNLPSEPGKPSLAGIGSIAEPNMDNVQVPSINDIAVPALPTANFSTFNGVAPDCTITEPDLDFSFIEGNFESDIHDALPAKIVKILDGSEPLVVSREVADDILLTASEQLDIEATKESDNIQNEWAMKGWNIPQGAMLGRLEELQAETARSKAATIRDIGVKQAELALDGIKAAMSTGAQYEGVMVGLFNNVQNRAFEAAKVGQDAALKLFETKVSICNAKITLYQAEASVYETLVKSEGLIFDAYRSQMEGVKAQVAVEEGKVSLFTARLQANEVKAKVYDSQIRSLASKAEIERLKVEMFKSEIEAFSSQVNAETAKYMGYRAQVDAELGKVQIASTESASYATRIQGINARNDAELKKLQQTVEVNRFTSQTNQEKLDSWRAALATTENLNNIELIKLKSEVEANSARGASNAAKADVYKVKQEGIKVANDNEIQKLTVTSEKNRLSASENQNTLEGFKSEVMGISAYNDAKLQKYSAEQTAYTERIKASLAEYDGTLRKYQADMGKWETEQRLALEAAKEKATIAFKVYEKQILTLDTTTKVYTQLAASALSTIQANASLSYKGAFSTSKDYNIDKGQVSKTCSESHRYEGTGSCG